MKKQWGANIENTKHELINTPIIEANTEQYNVDYPTLVEIYGAIRSSKEEKHQDQMTSQQNY